MNERRKVVIIDDSPIVRKMAEVALEEAGYEVYSAEDGEEGLRITKEVIPSVILVDFIMPKMSGYQFCQAINQDDELKNIPIILITAKGEDVGRKFLEKFGVIDYFIKPFKSSDLVDKVNSIVELQKTIFQPSDSEGEILVEEEEASLIAQEDTLSIESVKTFQRETTPKINSSEVQLADSLADSFSLDIIETSEVEDTEQSIEVKMSETLEDETLSIDSLKQLELDNAFDLAKTENHEVDKGDIASVEDDVAMAYEKAFSANDSQKANQMEDSFSISSIENSIERVTRKVLKEEIQLIIQKSVTDILRQSGIIKVPDILLSGSIRFFSIKDILSLIAHNRLTSKISILSEVLSSDIYFLDGQIIFASSNKTNSLLDFESIKNLSAEFSEQMKDSIYDILSEIIQLDSGTFSIEKMPTLDNLQSVPIRLGIPSSLIEASRRVDVKAYSNLFDDKTVFFKLLRDSTVKSYNLNKNEMRIFACINGERTVGEIIDISGLPSTETFRALYVLLNGGIVKIYWNC